MIYRGVPQTAMEFFKQFEGKSLQIYKDNTGKDTIYIGHLVKPGEVYLHTEADCWLYFEQDSKLAFDTVERLTDGSSNANEYLAMGSFTFNEGVGAFASSSLLKFFNKGDKIGAANQFLAWDKEHINGQLVQSEPLLKRRLIERTMFLTPVV